MCQAEFDMCPSKDKHRFHFYFIFGEAVSKIEHDRAAAIALAHSNAFQSPDMFPIFCDKLKNIEEIRRIM